MAKIFELDDSKLLESKDALSNTVLGTKHPP